MSDIGQTALTVNSRGEIKGFGPKWSCDNFAGADHNYNACPRCMGNYLTWLADNCRKGVTA